MLTTDGGGIQQHTPHHSLHLAARDDGHVRDQFIVLDSLDVQVCNCPLLPQLVLHIVNTHSL